MRENFYLEILTADRQFYIGQAEALILTIQDGLYEVLPGHENTAIALEPGVLKYKVNGEWHSAAESGGFAEITGDYVIVLVVTAERPDEIDFRRAEEARERAKERLRGKQSVMEYYNSKAALARAMARLKTRDRH